MSPNTTKTAPATINQCGYCIAESIFYFFAFSNSASHDSGFALSRSRFSWKGVLRFRMVSQDILPAKPAWEQSLIWRITGTVLPARGGFMQIDAGIRLSQPGSTIHCFVQDVWSQGALLIPDSVTNVPERFELLLAGDIRRSCEIIWRSNDRLGIAFLNTVH